MAPKNAQCTHLTMTRMYTSEFRCGVCFRMSTTGWVYRCTQDRELLIEDDAERGEVERMDALCDLFPPPSTPRKRGPSARASRLSFLDEISDSALKTYTPAQLSIVLTQRAHVLNVARETSESSSDDENFYYNYTDQSTSLPLFSQTPSPPKTATKLSQKPWLPPKGTECQFKCCHFCRPTLTERAFLSLNGIVNDDIPPTAIYGFGFHLHTKKRPVAPVKHVKNLGLRPSPPPRPENSIISPAQDCFFYLSAQQPQGLEILDPSIPERPLPPIPIPIPITIYEDHPLPAITQPNLSAAQVSHITAQNPHLSPYTNPARSILQRRLENASSNVAILTPLPHQTDEEVEAISAPLTLIEVTELEGRSGEQPLEVSGGVAVTEEAVGLHVADLITQV